MKPDEMEELKHVLSDVRSVLNTDAISHRVRNWLVGIECKIENLIKED
jgi:hypothetical protein